jgi:hypothetical protein
VGFLAILNAGIAYTRETLTVGDSVHIMSGKETGIIATWNVCEEKKELHVYQKE